MEGGEALEGAALPVQPQQDFGFQPINLRDAQDQQMPPQVLVEQEPGIPVEYFPAHATHGDLLESEDRQQQPHSAELQVLQPHHQGASPPPLSFPMNVLPPSAAEQGQLLQPPRVNGRQQLVQRPTTSIHQGGASKDQDGVTAGGFVVGEVDTCSGSGPGPSGAGHEWGDLSARSASLGSGKITTDFQEAFCQVIPSLRDFDSGKFLPQPPQPPHLQSQQLQLLTLQQQQQQQALEVLDKDPQQCVEELQAHLDQSEAQCQQEKHVQAASMERKLPLSSGNATFLEVEQQPQPLQQQQQPEENTVLSQQQETIVLRQQQEPLQLMHSQPVLLVLSPLNQHQPGPVTVAIPDEESQDPADEQREKRNAPVSAGERKRAPAGKKVAGQPKEPRVNKGAMHARKITPDMSEEEKLRTLRSQKERRKRVRKAEELHDLKAENAFLKSKEKEWEELVRSKDANIKALEAKLAECEKKCQHLETEIQGGKGKRKMNCYGSKSSAPPAGKRIKRNADGDKEAVVV